MHDSQVKLYIFQNTSIAVGVAVSEQVSRDVRLCSKG